jgi:DNA polymerase III delta prime subunit
MKRTEILTELLRPQQLSELTLPDREIERLERMVESNNLMNLIFYGPPGLGKTSAARIMVKNHDLYQTLQINGSLQTGIDIVRKRIEQFASSSAMFGGRKVCLIDEADFLSVNAQASMRGVVEKFAKNCRFLLTVNDLSKIMPALKSRMIAIPFAINPKDRSLIVKRLQERLADKLTELAISFDRERLNQIVSIYFPDLRSVVNHLEWEFA